VAPESSFSITVDISKAQGVIKKFLVGLGLAGETNKRAARKIADILVKRLRLEAPTGKYWTLDGEEYEGGTLKESIKYNIFEGGATIFKGFSTKAQFTMKEYGRYTLPPGLPSGRDIFPRRAPFLLFYWPKIDQVMHMKEVHQDPRPGDPWDERALDAVREQMKIAWAEEFNQWRVKIIERS